VRAIQATPEAAPEWIAHAERVTVRRLEDDVEHAIVSETGGPPGPNENSPWPSRELQTRAPDTRSEGTPQETARFFFRAPPESARFIRAAIASMRRHLEKKWGRIPTEGEAFGVMIEHACQAWGDERRVPRRYAIYDRDGWRCTVPGCTSYRNLHQHHIDFRSRGGGDEDENLVTVCAWHHLRAAHGRPDSLRISGRAPHALTFELGGIATYGSGDRLLDLPPPAGVEGGVEEVAWI
jgi:hypothetical protein